MRVVLDTNVVISGVFFGGLPRRILQAWRDRRVHIVVSPEILDEYQRVGRRLGQRFDGVDLQPFLQLLGVHGELVEAPALGESVTQDEDDEKFFACALAAGVGFIVSGDSHLLESSGWNGIEVVTPSDFVERFL
ncbi:MAG: putative toxin-antitoxin system toxin component, PIN family [Gemmatimonadales bacterium]|nr:MAG: putative toxin-antitoxin system toxin component, PIN family [Gemmatimonadales bacterium]